MAFDVSALTNYTEENADKIYRAAIFGANTLKTGVEIMAGIKRAETINILSSTGNFQAWSGCSYNTSGSTVFTQRTLTVAAINSQETLCPRDLETKYTSKRLTKGSNYEMVDYWKEILADKIANINANLEYAIWKGDDGGTMAAFPNQKLFDGWLRVIDDASGVIAATTQASISTSTVRGIFEDIYTKIPAALIGQTEMPIAYCGWDTFRTLMNKLTTDNLYHYTTDSAAQSGTITYPGTNLKIVATHGLNAVTGHPANKNNRIICTRPSNLVYGTDGTDEYDRPKVWYSQDDMNVKTHFGFKAGCQIKFPGEIVQYANT